MARRRCGLLALLAATSAVAVAALRSSRPGDAAEAAVELRRTVHPARTAGAVDDEFDFWICLDFEWTCDQGEGRLVRADQGEIIEFAFIIYDVRDGQVPHEAQHYCKPLRTPVTEYCTELTGISNHTLIGAGTLPEAIAALERALVDVGAKGKSCCAVAHGSADLELTLPRNCRDLGLAVPPELRRYIDLRVATQSFLEASDRRHERAHTMRQICEALHVEMVGQEHCGIDDSWMVLFAMTQLLENGAELHCIDIDAERAAFLSGDGAYGEDAQLVLDGLPYQATGLELQAWVAEHTREHIHHTDIQIVLGLDGKPSGRAVVGFSGHEAAASALRALDGGKTIVCGSIDQWPFKPPTERLVLARPLRPQERSLRLSHWASAVDVGEGPAMAPFPRDSHSLRAILRRPPAKPKPAPAEPAIGCSGIVKFFDTIQGFGFIASDSGDVFVHKSACIGSYPKAGDFVGFDILRDDVTGRTKAVDVYLIRAAKEM